MRVLWAVGFLVLGCGGQASDTSAVPTGDAGSDADADSAAPPDADASTLLPLPCGITQADVEALAASQVQADLELKFAPFIQGEVAVYQGTASAHDNASAIPGFTDGVLSDQVLGALRQGYFVGTASEYSLEVIGRTTTKWFWMTESQLASDHVNVGMVLDFAQSGGSWGTTTQAIASFWDAPDPAINFAAHADGLYADDTTPFATDVEVALQRVSPANVTLDDVLRLQAADPVNSVGPFVKKETRAELVWSTSTGTPSCTPVGSGYLEGECGLAVELTALEFVDPDDLSNYGYENVQISSAKVCCSHCDAPQPEGCGPDFKYDCFP